MQSALEFLPAQYIFQALTPQLHRFRLNGGYGFSVLPPSFVSPAASFVPHNASAPVPASQSLNPSPGFLLLLTHIVIN